MTETEAFWRTSAFHERWGAAARATPATPDDFAPGQPAPEPLIQAFWQVYGWGPRGDGFLVLAPPAQLLAQYAAWPLPAGALPLLRTAWGHLFLVLDGTAWLLDPQDGELHDLGCDAVSLLDTLLVADDFLGQVLLHGDYAAAIAQLGRTPGTSECLAVVQMPGQDGEAPAREVAIKALADALEPRSPA